MKAKTADEILRALDGGVMAAVAKDISQADRIAIAEFVSGKQVGQTLGALPDGGRCKSTAPLSASEGAQWNGWGNGITNSRFQSTAAAAITPDTVRKLKLKWAFGLQGSVTASAQPAVIGGRMFIGGSGGNPHVYSLDASTGCVDWEFSTEAGVRTAITVGQLQGSEDQAIYFGDVAANAYAVNASTGALIWKTKLDTHAAARITGAPTLYSGVLYVPVSSIEEATGSRPGYQCCTFRGSVVALDAKTGKQIWKTYTIPDEPQPTKVNGAGTQQYGPSGASVWSAPTIDTTLQALYIATGNSYSAPAADTSDSVIALDLKTGAMLWHQQATPNDSFMVGCISAEQDELPGQPWAGPRFRSVADPRDLGGREAPARHRTEIRRRTRVRSRSARQDRLAVARWQRAARSAGASGARPPTRITSTSPTRTSDFCRVRRGSIPASAAACSASNWRRKDRMEELRRSNAASASSAARRSPLP